MEAAKFLCGRHCANGISRSLPVDLTDVQFEASVPQHPGFEHPLFNLAPSQAHWTEAGRAPMRIRPIDNAIDNSNDILGVSSYNPSHMHSKNFQLLQLPFESGSLIDCHIYRYRRFRKRLAVHHSCS